MNMTTDDKANPVEASAQCICANLTYVLEFEMATMRDKRHHPACPLYRSEKHPRLFYFEEAENCYIPAPDLVKDIVAIESFIGHDDTIEIEFKRIDMTDEEFYSLEEV